MHIHTWVCICTHTNVHMYTHTHTCAGWCGVGGGYGEQLEKSQTDPDNRDQL